MHYIEVGPGGGEVSAGVVVDEVDAVGASESVVGGSYRTEVDKRDVEGALADVYHRGAAVFYQEDECVFGGVVFELSEEVCHVIGGFYCL